MLTNHQIVKLGKSVKVVPYYYNQHILKGGNFQVSQPLNGYFEDQLVLRAQP